MDILTILILPSAGYKVNVQKSVAFLDSNNELSEREINETIPFTTTSKKIKYLGIKLSKDMKDLCSENSKTMMKKSRDDTKIWKNITFSWTGKINNIDNLFSKIFTPFYVFLSSV